jgi:hypothetical protein
MRRTLTLLVALLLVGPVACTSSNPGHVASSHSSSRVLTFPTPTPTTADPTMSDPTTSAAPTTSAPPKRKPKPKPKPSSSKPAPRGPELPRGGRRILPANRIVAYYGAPGGDQLGVLGRGTPDQAADAVERQAAKFAPFGRHIQPAMELIATVAQGGPGADGLYSKAISPDDIARYLDAAHRHKLLLVLDFQPGRGEFLPQVEQDERFLLDPSVSVALDPEWKVGPEQVPARVIGSASAASVNAVGHYLSGLVARHHLPDKLLVVHEFTRTMLPDRDDIARPPGLEVVLHADGLATPAKKITVYHQLGFPSPPFHVGFKLFYKADTGLMTPGQVMALRPQPEIVTYQ